MLSLKYKYWIVESDTCGSTYLSDTNLLESYIIRNLPQEISGYKITDVSKLDGIKVRIMDNYWILFRFSGTEPLLRLYCEAFSEDILKSTLDWGRKFINQIIS